jgi:multidrug efflux pump subunit AcrA (membrane-fusion protein)
LTEVRVGGEAGIRVTAYPNRVFRGAVEAVSRVNDTPLGVRVRSLFPNPRGELKLGMLASISIARRPRPSVTVPAEAVSRVGDAAFASVVVSERGDGSVRITRRRVVVNDAGGGVAAVLDGLRAGERILCPAPPSIERTDGEVSLTAQQFKSAGIRTMLVPEPDRPHLVRISGVLTFDERELQRVVAPTDGHVSKAFVRVGQQVTKGAPLLSLSAPAVGTRETLVASPIGGRVIDIAAREESTIAARPASGGQLAVIGRTETVWLSGRIAEADLPLVRQGDDVELRTRSFPETRFHGKVEWISPTLEGDTHTAEIRCVFGNKDHLLDRNLQGHGRYESLEGFVLGPPAPRIPRDALVRVGNALYVLVTKGRRSPEGTLLFRRQKVVADDLEEGAEVPVVSGLAPGDEVVVGHAVLLLGRP